MEVGNAAANGGDVVSLEDENLVEVFWKLVVDEILDLMKTKRDETAQCVQTCLLHAL